MTADKKTEPTEPESFLSRWARVKHSQAHVTPARAETLTGQSPATTGENSSIDGPPRHKTSGEAHPEPTLPDQHAPVALPSLDSLTPQSDFSPFMSKDVDPQSRNLAMKKLFTDPHYNVMDRLDIYIDDYSVHTPLPLEVIRQMNIAKTLGLFDDEEEGDKVAPGETAAPTVPQAEAIVVQHPPQLDDGTPRLDEVLDTSNTVARAPFRQ